MWFWSKSCERRSSGDSWERVSLSLKKGGCWEVWSVCCLQNCCQSPVLRTLSLMMLPALTGSPGLLPFSPSEWLSPPGRPIVPDPRTHSSLHYVNSVVMERPWALEPCYLGVPPGPWLPIWMPVSSYSIIIRLLTFPVWLGPTSGPCLITTVSSEPKMFMAPEAARKVFLKESERELIYPSCFYSKWCNLEKVI